MAVLDATNRFRTMARFLRDLAPPAGCTKADIQAAVDAADSWVDSNAAAYNSALPNPFRTNASAAQKAVLIAYICMRRAGKLPVEEDVS